MNRGGVAVAGADAADVGAAGVGAAGVWARAGATKAAKSNAKEGERSAVMFFMVIELFEAERPEEECFNGRKRTRVAATDWAP